jgi:hypothetical protein
MPLNRIKSSPNPPHDLSILLEELHKNGAKDPKTLEILSFYKELHPDVFSEFEEKILSALGLFYKIEEPDNLYSFLMAQFGEQHKEAYRAILTPVQASIRRAIDTYQYTSISAPTSAGKSYSIRDFISEGTGDAVIVVPSRALIAEYINTMRRKFGNNKNVMVSSFVDLVYTSRHLRRIFILTPERSKDLYKIKHRLNIETFFFDEAQTSQEEQRGVIFDVTVRRVRKHFPEAKIIFAHPFVANPEAQFSKHGISNDQGYAKSYSHGSVGRICVFKHKNNGKWYYFSPYLENGHNISNSLELQESFKDFALRGTHTILVYVSKSSIYNDSFTDGFVEYIDGLEPVTNPQALEIIANIKHILGANTSSHRSSMVEFLKKGVVIHHGSIPLEVRFLIEDFIRGEHASLCFATSTLAQGINMPFDIVWLINNRFMGNEDERALNFKNLIGRAGRLSKEEKFDYGYVYTSDPKGFSSKINASFSLTEESILDNPNIRAQDSDTAELIESIQKDTFDDDKNLPLSKVGRLSQDAVLENAKEFLDIIYSNPNSIKDSIGGDASKYQQATNHLQKIYEASLGRDLVDGEQAVFREAISIFFKMAQGRSFREIVGMRYNYIIGRDDTNNRDAKFSQPAEKLPNSSINFHSIYTIETPINRVSYDAIVFDTYDYMDQVISFSLSDTFIAAFKIYNEFSEDERAEQIIELFRYGTNDSKHILLMRYGFPPEMISEISEYVTSVNEARVVFNESIYSAPSIVRDLVEWYLPAQSI